MSFENLIWVEHYRPRTIDDCILPERIKSILRKMVEDKNIQHYSAIGKAGSGKTSSARALCEQLGIDYILINMSNESGIETVRNKIVNFASTMSFSSDYKVIIMDEFDSSTRAAQDALRGVVELFQNNCRFIITGNDGNRIIDPLFSRAPKIDFSFTKEEKIDMIVQFIDRIKFILDDNNIKYDLQQVIQLCKSNFPDFRSLINFLQLNSKNGELTINSLGVNSTKKIDELISYLKDGKFTKYREWIVENVQNNDGNLLRRAIYDRLKDFIKPDSIPNAVLLINQYDYRENFVVDTEINNVAFLTELMMNVEFL